MNKNTENKPLIENIDQFQDDPINVIKDRLSVGYYEHGNNKFNEGFKSGVGFMLWINLIIILIALLFK